MSVTPGPAPERCSLCHAPLPGDVRCPNCGLAPGFGPERRTPFTAVAVWWMIGAVLAVYLVTLGVVVLTR
jgi:hypothetical protein